VVQFAPAEQFGRVPDRVIVINLAARGSRTFQGIVDEIANLSKMRVNSKEALWGDRTATELIAQPATDGRPKTMRALVLEREGYVFALGFVATSMDANDDRIFDTVANNTIWLKVARAGAGVAPREPGMGLNSGIFVSIPDPFRPDPTVRPRNAAVFAARDLPSRVNVAKLTVQPMPKSDKIQSLADMKAIVDQHMVPAWRVRQPMRWRDSAGVVQFSLSTQAQTDDGWAQALIARTPDGNVTLFSVQCRHSNEAYAGMEHVLTLLRASIRLAPPQPASAEPAPPPPRQPAPTPPARPAPTRMPRYTPPSTKSPPPAQ
jgi:hypothetical protein